MGNYLRILRKEKTLEEFITTQDVESIKQSRHENATFVKTGEKAVKWLNCPKYDACLTWGFKKDAVNWTCLKCSLVKNAHIRDLVIFRASKTINTQTKEEVKELEKLWNIKTSKTDDHL